MAIMKILTYPDSNLRKKAAPVTEFNTELSKLIDAMFETMYGDNGIGLAATQVNIQQRVVVIDLGEKGSQPITLINPIIIEKKGKVSSQEGCLSVPGAYENVMRAETIRYTTQDLEGNETTHDAEGLHAACVQHEIDHLDGILFIDHLSTIKRDRVRKQLLKIKKARL
jgi:peptide deformylase